jgi:hypothetical protein
LNHVPELTDEERVRRAEQAQQVMRNEMYREAWASLVSDLQSAWESTKPMQVAEREEIWRALKTVKAVQQKLENLMAVGRQAANAINQREKRSANGLRPIR